jgi:hypothetical protein
MVSAKRSHLRLQDHPGQQVTTALRNQRLHRLRDTKGSFKS